MAHKRIFKIIFIFLHSFRAKTVYKVVTVVQPPFMMWNATTGAPWLYIYYDECLSVCL